MNYNINEVVKTTAQHPDYEGEIIQLLRSNLTPKVMVERIRDYHENDIAAALEQMTPEDRARVYTILDASTLADILDYAQDAQTLLDELTIRKRMDVLAHLEPQTAAEYLRQLDKNHRQSLLELMDGQARSQLLLVSSLNEDEIGSKMSTNYISIPAGVTIKEAMGQLVRQAADNDNITTLYVVDEAGALVGAIDLKDLIIAREGTDLEDITMTSYPYVYMTEQIQDCMERIKDYSEDSIPVLDSNNVLRGVLTSQDLTQLVDDEMGEDYAMLAGLTAEEDLQEPLKKSIAKRLPWLIVLLGLGLVVSSVVGAFEHVVAHLALIVSFQSLILDMAGNVGTQSLAVTIRVLMDEELSGKEKLFLVVKEARVGLVNGFILGGLAILLIGLYLVLLKSQTLLLAFSVSLCTGIALVVSILLSSVTGTVVPILFKKFGVDPAVASGPLITTLNDLVAVITYYGLAWILLIRFLNL